MVSTGAAACSGRPIGDVAALSARQVMQALDVEESLLQVHQERAWILCETKMKIMETELAMVNLGAFQLSCEAVGGLATLAVEGAEMHPLRKSHRSRPMLHPVLYQMRWIVSHLACRRCNSFRIVFGWRGEGVEAEEVDRDESAKS